MPNEAVRIIFLLIGLTTQITPLSVRCDLKDLPLASTGPYPACSNCQERGINCV
jgi:hypothetical protein